MADPIVFEPYTSWVDVVDDNNVPQGARPVNASDLMRYERFGEQGAAAINEHEGRIDSLELMDSAHTQEVNDLAVRVDDLLNTAVQHTAAMSSAIPTVSTVISSTLTLPFRVPASGRVLVELSMHVKTTAKGNLHWIVADSATPFAVIFTNTVLNNIFEGYITTRRLITGLTVGQQKSWQWRHQIVSPGAGTLQIGANYPAVMSVRAA